AGADLKRRGDEYREEIGELLQGVIVGPAVIGGEMQRPVLNHHRESVREHRPGRGYQPLPLVGGKEHPVECGAIEHPQLIDGEMPPARGSYRVPDSRNAEPPGNRYRVALGRPDLLWRNEHIEGPHLLAAPVVLGPPYAIFWNRVQKPKPVGIRRAVPVPVQARMIGQYLDARA